MRRWLPLCSEIHCPLADRRQKPTPAHCPPLTAGIALGLVALVKLLGAVIPVGVAYGQVPWPRLWRGISWAGGLLLVAYGGINSTVALAVLAGVIRPESGYDADAMMGHAYLWDPLFVLWGGALVLSLWFSRPTWRPAR